MERQRAAAAVGAAATVEGGHISFSIFHLMASSAAVIGCARSGLTDVRAGRQAHTAHSQTDVT